MPAPSFGTDGVRGVANRDLTPEFTLALGRAAARVLGTGPWLIGRDPRRSGPLLEAALVAGLTAEGADVELLGVVPTPAVAHLGAVHDRPGAMISASHNPFGDNGIKLFAAGGRKLDDPTEDALEALLADINEHGPGVAVPVGAGVGRVTTGDADVAAYHDHLVAALGGRSLADLHVVLDCGHGAASGLAADVFARTGAKVEVLHADPDGTNINARVGSTEPALLQRAVLDHGADVGLAFDGDADRVIAVDERGDIVDGDHVIALCALALRERGDLDHDTVVVTVMSNLGFRLAMDRVGISVVETPVGDRAVLEALDAGGYALGGEQSGHVIFRRVATTGDGMLTGLHLLDLVSHAGRPLSALAAEAMTRVPQVLRNVEVAERDPDLTGTMSAELGRAELRLGSTGRVLLRPSGTEPLVRVMVEAEDAALADEVATELARAVERRYGPP